MLFLVCKKNLVCARGHVASVSCASVWRRGDVPGRCARAELKCFHFLRFKLSSPVARCSSYTPSPAPGLAGQCVTGSPHRRGHERTTVSSLAGLCLKFQPPGLEATRALLGVRLPPVNPGPARGWRGLCSGKPREPPPDPPGEEPRSSPPAPGLFQFKELYENPWTVPNLLCVCRIVLAPVLAYLITEQHFSLSLGLFTLAGATDLLDGYIARNWANQKSALGSALDPLADKILISVLYISLTYAQLIPAPLTVLVISRDIALIAAVFYVRYKTVPPPVTLSRFFNPCYTTAQLKPTLISKVNTVIQLFLVAASLASPVFHYSDSLLLQSLWYVTAVTTAASGYSYYHYGKKTVEVLNNTK